MSAVFDNNIKHNQHLEVHDILKWLEEDEMVDVDNAHMLRTLAVSAEYKKKNPLEVIAERNWTNLENEKLLTLDHLTKWFADRVDLPRGVPRRTGGEFVAFQQDAVFPAVFDQMEQDRTADDTAADDDHACR